LKKKKPAVITNFFGPSLKPQAISLSTALASSSQTQLQDTEKVVIDVDESPILDHASPEKAAEGSPLDTPPVQDVTFLSRLRMLAANLPISIPVGKQDEPLGCFAANPRDLILPEQDAWEDVIDPTFNRVIGFGKSTPEIATLIRRGSYGMDGFCDWTTACIEHLGIPSSLLEMRLERVMQAMINLYVSKFSVAFYAKVRLSSSGASETPTIKATTQTASSRSVHQKHALFYC